MVKNGETDVTDKFDVAISQEGADNGLTGNTDAKVDASNVYKVTVTPKDSAEAKALADTRSPLTSPLPWLQRPLPDDYGAKNTIPRGWYFFLSHPLQ